MPIKDDVHGKRRSAGWLAMSAAALLLGVFATGAYAIAGLDPPTNVSPPIVTGTPQVGRTLTCVPGAWNGAPPISYTYQWNRNGSAIGGATSATYAVAGSDAGTSITCTERASNLLGSGSVTSAAVVPTALTTDPSQPGPPPAGWGDVTGPVLSGFKVTPRRAPLYVVATKRGPKVRPHRRLKLKFRLSEQAAVVISAYHRGKAPKKVTDPGGSWSVKLGVGDHTLQSHQSIKYTRMGRYVITARATDAAGNRSVAATATFRVTKPRRR
jgi:hypothetical protein